MKKIHITIILGFLLMISSLNLRADDTDNHPPGAEVIDLIFMRPAGLVALVGGSGLFLALSPLTAIATVSPPHDAFDRLANHIILKPYVFTFDRPLGDMESNRIH